MSNIIVAGVNGLKASMFKEDKFDNLKTVMILTPDKKIIENKTYYTRVLTDVDKYVYLTVSNPIPESLGSYYEPVIGEGHEFHFRDGYNYHGDYYTIEDPNYKPGLIDGYKAIAATYDEVTKKWSYPTSPEDPNFLAEAEQFIDYKDKNKDQDWYNPEKDTLSLPPSPDTKIGITAGAFAEKPVYVPVGPNKEESVIFPLSSGLAQLSGYKSSTYLPLNEEDKMHHDAVSSIPRVDYKNTATDYRDNTYKSDLMCTYKGVTPFDNQTVNLLDFENHALYDGKGKLILPWFDCWRSANNNYAEYSSTEYADINPVLATDGLSISPTVGQSDSFIYEFIVTEATDLNLSAYFRCPKSNTFVQGPTICAKNFDEKFTSISQLPVVDKDTETIVTKVNNNEDRLAFKITDKWQRIGTIAKNVQPGTYYAIITWPLGYTTEEPSISNSRTSLKVAAMLLSKDSSLPVYDCRVVNKSQTGILYRPAIFDINTPMNKVLSKNKDWTIIYDRRIQDNTLASNLHIDRVGQYMFGYLGDKIFAGTDTTEVTSVFEPSNLTVEDFYNTAETIIIQHNKDNKTLTINTYAPSKDGISSYFKHTEVIENVTTIDNLTLNSTTYQLQLGGQSPEDNTGDCYRCLVLIPFAADTTKIVDEYLALSEVDNKRVVLRNHYIEEGLD